MPVSLAAKKPISSAAVVSGISSGKKCPPSSGPPRTSSAQARHSASGPPSSAYQEIQRPASAPQHEQRTSDAPSGVAIGHVVLVVERRRSTLFLADGVDAVGIAQRLDIGRPHLGAERIGG